VSTHTRATTPTAGDRVTIYYKMVATEIDSKPK
jgi:hypothetical protein